MMRRSRVYVLIATMMFLGSACSSDGGSGGTGGKGSGGSPGGGGQPGTGGSSASATGGAPGSGGSSTGTVGTGGRPGTGGTNATGGTTSGTGGKEGGPDASMGGRMDVDAGRGGAPGTGGVAIDGGPRGAGGSTTPSTDAVKSDGCGKTPTLKNGNGLSITVGGTARKYNLKAPDNYDNTHPYRLIMAYHWLGGKADDVSNGGVAKPYYGLWDLAQGSTIFVAPDGTGNQWGNSNGADVEFSRQLITLIESEFCIDKSRIFCEGFSMGGSMSYAMACGMGDVIRAVAVHSGGTMSGCAKHDKPVPYFMTHGTKDSVCTWPSFPMPPLADFAKLDGCTTPDPGAGTDKLAASLAQPTDSSGKTPACTDFTGCKAGYPVRACLFVGDHTPSPGGTSGWVPTETWKFITQF